MRSSWSLALAVLVACTRSEAPAPAPSASAPASASVSASTPASAPPPPASSLPAHEPWSAIKVLPSTKTLDTSDWKGTAPEATLEVRWTVDQTKATPPVPVDAGVNHDLTKHKVPLELSLTLNGHAHTVSLTTHAGPEFSDTCSQALFYYAGIGHLFKMTRIEGGRVLLTRTDQQEFAGETKHQLYVFDLPENVRVAAEVVVVAPDGKRTSKTCTAARLPNR
jgi:hypothetical protein